MRKVAPDGLSERSSGGIISSEPGKIQRVKFCTYKLDDGQPSDND